MWMEVCLSSKDHVIHKRNSIENINGTDDTHFGKNYLSLEDYDCIGFDLDHTLCRYNVGPMIR